MVGKWKIEVRDGLELVFERTISRGQITGSQVEALLRTLDSKYGLSGDEIVNCYAKKKTLIKENKLTIQLLDSKILSSGSNPYVVAIPID